MNKQLINAIGSVLKNTTDQWKRIDAKALGHAEEEAVNLLSAAGLLEVRLVVIVQMGEKKMPRCRYVGGGPWWALIEAEFDRLEPANWRGKDGKPKENLVRGASVVAIRLTDDGVDYRENVGFEDSLKRLTTDAVEPILRCDGVSAAKAAPPERETDVSWSAADTPTRWAKVFRISAKSFKRRVKEGKIRAKPLSDRSYQVDTRDIPKSD